jgi:nucleotide-binding universal stress UspA family protein
MKAAVCFDGIDDEALVQAALESLRCCSQVESWCAYGHTAAELVEHVMGRHHGPPHLPHPPHPPHRPHASSLDAEQARGIADHGVILLQRVGIAATAHIVGGENPEHALAASSGEGVMLILGAGHRGGVGPHSIGHVARFVIDHARGPVLVLRSAS